jgi:hypothetical protein
MVWLMGHLSTQDLDLLGFCTSVQVLPEIIGELLIQAVTTYNVSGNELYPNLSNAEVADGTNTNYVDILSNGFKVRNPNQNASGSTYIYMAFAENPFKNSNAR